MTLEPPGTANHTLHHQTCHSDSVVGEVVTVGRPEPLAGGGTAICLAGVVRRGAGCGRAACDNTEARDDSAASISLADTVAGESFVGKFPVEATAMVAATMNVNPTTSSFGCHMRAAVLLSPVR
jgi:hypothetical protein